MNVEPTLDLMTLLTGMEAAIIGLDAKLTALTAVHAELRTQPTTPPASRGSYSTKEAARMLGRAGFTVRAWCNNGRIRATKREERRGSSALWCISVSEITRFQDEGLLPLDPHRNAA